MSEKHLCRAKRTDNGDWITGNRIDDGVTGQVFIHAVGNSVNESDKVGEEGCLCFLAFEVNPSTICQCTEIGKEVGIDSTVWENEIYQWDNAAYGKCIGIIRYGKYLQDGSGSEYPEIACYGFYVEVVKVEPYHGMDVSDYPDYLKTISVFEIFLRSANAKLLGNMIDNPELLEVGE